MFSIAMSKRRHWERVLDVLARRCRSDGTGSEHFGSRASARIAAGPGLPAQVYKWRRLAELGVIGVPGASELPPFVAVEITKDVPSLPAPVLEDKPATADDHVARRAADAK
jgi:hypothetical protein